MIEIKYCPSTLAEGYDTYRLADARIKRVLDKYMAIPEPTIKLVGNSFLNDKMKRKYLRIVDERVKRFIRKSE